MWNYLHVWVAARFADLREETGQTAVEYAMVIGLVAIVLAVALAVGGTNVFGDLWQRVADAISGDTGA